VAFNREIFGTKRWVDPWPWDAQCDKRKTHDDIKRLVISGALIAAEIDRLKRKEKRDTPEAAPLSGEGGERKE
jgi:hypothetical protein